MARRRGVSTLAVEIGVNVVDVAEGNGGIETGCLGAWVLLLVLLVARVIVVYFLCALPARAHHLWAEIVLVVHAQVLADVTLLACCRGLPAQRLFLEVRLRLGGLIGLEKQSGYTDQQLVPEEET